MCGACGGGNVVDAAGSRRDLELAEAIVPERGDRSWLLEQGGVASPKDDHRGAPEGLLGPSRLFDLVQFVRESCKRPQPCARQKFSGFAGFILFDFYSRLNVHGRTKPDQYTLTIWNATPESATVAIC